jgi:uncharacterized alkaline shock family protein YloU
MCVTNDHDDLVNRYRVCVSQMTMMIWLTVRVCVSQMTMMSWLTVRVCVSQMTMMTWLTVNHHGHL